MPPSQKLDSNAPSQLRKPGPKPKALEDRVYKPSKPIKRREASYSRQKKIEVLKFLTHHKVFLDGSISHRPDRYREPTIAEAARHFNIPRRSISNWVKQSDQILNNATKNGMYSTPYS